MEVSFTFRVRLARIACPTETTLNPGVEDFVA